ncbi:MAG: M15 family metallopeptidase [Oscillospiraceae bacterium]|nr:M15 family metallopeptidase [Oscillospiraceae bacterium]
MSKNKTTGNNRDYQRDVERTLRGCTVDAFVWGGIAVIFLAAGLYSVIAGLPGEFDRYRQSAMLLCFTAFLATGAKCLQSLSERTAIQDVVQESVYAVMMTQKQQNKIFRTVGWQSFLEHLTYFLFGAVPVTGIMLYLYYTTRDTSPLFAMGILDGLLLFGTLLAYGLDVGRLSSRDGFCTVSEQGIIAANEILPFSAKDGDVLKLVSYDDIYELIFRRKCFLGILRKYTFPLPKGGVLSKAVDGKTEEEVLLEAFRLIEVPVQDAVTQEEQPSEQEKEEQIPEAVIEVPNVLPEVTEEVTEEETEKVVAESYRDLLTARIQEEPAALEEEPEGTIPEEETEDPTEELAEEIPEETTEAAPEEEPSAQEEDEEEKDLPVVTQNTEEAEETVSKEEDEIPQRMQTEEEKEEFTSIFTREEEEPTPVRSSAWLKRAAAIAAAVLLVALIFVFVHGTKKTPEPVPSTTPSQNQPTPSVKPTEPIPGKEDGAFVDETPKSELQQDENGIWYAVVGGEEIILVNKEHPLPSTYVGKSEEASRALSDMIQAASNEGVNIVFVSGYRSYDLQTGLYANKVAQIGEPAAAYWVAPPGTSEHQTGLAFDVNETGNDEALLNTGFEDTEAFRWLEKHCSEFGFILRYPKGARDITGFNYEPWHYRYVGKEAAQQIMESGVTLEEYLGVYIPQEG